MHDGNGAKKDMGQSRKTDDKFDLERVALAMPRVDLISL